MYPYVSDMARTTKRIPKTKQKLTRVEVLLDGRELDKLEHVRGKVPRSAFFRELLEQYQTATTNKEQG